MQILHTECLNVLNEAGYHHSDRAEQEDACKRIDQQ